jgi:4-hydroxy-4-methyl-2-oxoglutarate aldolase
MLRPGDVLVIDGRGGNLALAGEMFAMEAARKKLGGIVVDGGIRDSAAMQDIDLPVYARFIHPGRRYNPAGRCHSGAVSCGGVVVSPGDIVFADADGIVCGTDAELEQLLKPASGLMQNEEKAYAAFKRARG